jgi:hypothetical protein
MHEDLLNIKIVQKLLHKLHLSTHRALIQIELQIIFSWQLDKSGYFSSGFSCCSNFGASSQSFPGLLPQASFRRSHHTFLQFI